MTLIKAITFENFDYMVSVEDILPGLEQDLNTAMENVEDPEAVLLGKVAGIVGKTVLKEGTKHLIKHVFSRGRSRNRRRRRRRRRRRCKKTRTSYLIYFIHLHGHKKRLLKKKKEKGKLFSKLLIKNFNRN